MILGKTIVVKHWRDLARYTVEYAIQVGKFDQVAESVPKFLAQEAVWTSRSVILSNGWYLYVNLSADACKHLCKRIFACLGIAESEWSIIEEEDATENGNADDLMGK